MSNVPARALDGSRVVTSTVPSLAVPEDGMDVGAVLECETVRLFAVGRGP